MRRVTKKRASYRSIEALPETVVGEIVAGELHVSPRPGVRHTEATSALLTKLRTRFGGPRRGGWHILFQPEQHLGPDVLVPDVAGWRRERLPTLPDTAAFELSPDWVCEVVSRDSARLDRMLKLPRYAAHEVANAWLVDPVARTIESFGNEKGRWVLLGSYVGDGVARIAPFESYRLSLSAVWAGFR